MGTLDNLNRERGQSKQRRRKRGAQPFSPEGAETRFGTDAACKGGTFSERPNRQADCVWMQTLSEPRSRKFISFTISFKRRHKV